MAGDPAICWVPCHVCVCAKPAPAFLFADCTQLEIKGAMCRAGHRFPDLEHGSDVLQVGGHGKAGLHVTDALHQDFGCLCHLLHLNIVQQPPLLVARDVLCNQGRATR